MLVLSSCGGLVPSTSSESSTTSDESSSSENSVSESSVSSESSEEVSSSTISSESSSEISSSSSEEISSSSSSSEESSSSSEETYTVNYQKITSTSRLINGSEVVLGYNSGDANYAAGALAKSGSTYYLKAVESTIVNNAIRNLGEGVKIYTINKSDSGWSFTDSNGKLLGASSAKRMTLGSSSATNYWNITITNGEATIKSTNSSFGSLLFNPTSPRFTNYTSGQKAPSLYLVSEPTPISPTSISLGSSSYNVDLNSTKQLQVSYTPSTANTDLEVEWKSSNSSVASVSSAGLVSALSFGEATITATLKNIPSISATTKIIVPEIAPTSIAIEGAKTSLRLNGTQQLSVKYTPSNANTNLDVEWKSSNSSVLSVNSTGLVTGLAEGSATITASLKSNSSINASVTVNVVVQESYTILIYMCGSNLESDYANKTTITDDYGNTYQHDGVGLATSDIKEILSVKNQPDNVNIVIETGGAKAWTNKSYGKYGSYDIDSTKLQRHHVEDGQIYLDQSLTYASMGNTSTLQSFLEYGINNYEADKYGVILWNHGGGLGGCCYDEKKSDDPLTTAEVYNAVKGAYISTNQTKKFEWIGYDCCLMMNQDIADYNSDYFNYMIASQESEAGEGWDYDTWVDDLYNDPSIDTKELLSTICEGFIADNGGKNVSTYQGYAADQTLSVLDLSKAVTYREAWEDFASKLNSATSSASTFGSLMNNVKLFSSEAYYGNYDALDMINKIVANSTYKSNTQLIDAANTLKAAFNEYVCYNCAQKGAGNANGLCCYYINSYEYVLSASSYSSLTRFTNWATFVNKFKNTSGGYYW